MSSRILRTPEHVDSFVDMLADMRLPITVSWVKGADRTDQQNRLMWLWASEAARWHGDRDPADVQAEWKLTIGVPILRADDPEFRREYDSMIRPLGYEAKLRVMKVLGFSVTSRMKSAQMVRFLDEVERVTRAEGVDLTQPDPELSEYHGRVRQRDAA